MWSKNAFPYLIALGALLVAIPSLAIDKIIIRYTPNHPVNIFSSNTALGAALDGQDKGEVPIMLSHYNVRRMLQAGFQTVSYRLRTELAVEAWHWNPKGRWSDPKRHQGHLISDTNTL